MVVPNLDKISFYDFKLKGKFIPSEFMIKQKGGRRFAVAMNPKTGFTSWRTIGKNIQ